MSNVERQKSPQRIHRDTSAPALPTRGSESKIPPSHSMTDFHKTWALLDKLAKTAVTGTKEKFIEQMEELKRISSAYEFQAIQMNELRKKYHPEEY